MEEEQQPPRCGGAGEDFNKIYPRLHTAATEERTQQRERETFRRTAELETRSGHGKVSRHNLVCA